MQVNLGCEPWHDAPQNGTRRGDTAGCGAVSMPGDGRLRVWSRRECDQQKSNEQQARHANHCNRPDATAALDPELRVQNSEPSDVRLLVLPQQTPAYQFVVGCQFHHGKMTAQTAQAKESCQFHTPQCLI